MRRQARLFLERAEGGEHLMVFHIAGIPLVSARIKSDSSRNEAATTGCQFWKTPSRVRLYKRFSGKSELNVQV